MKKRIISLLLCAAMLLTLLPQTVLFASAATSGTCGTNLRWSYNSSTYTLTITGTGAMKNWSYSSSAPWYSYRSSIKSVSLPDGLTGIGNYAFAECTGLTAISIPDSVTSIGSDAFCFCTGLTAISIPDSVTSIGGWAFAECTGLTAISIPDSVTSIGWSAFDDCTGLTEVHISDIAAWCGISFGPSTTNPLYFAKKLYLNGTLITDLVIPSGVTSIGDYAFDCFTGLTAISIPDSVTSIGSCAFYGCTGLTSITIPDSVASIGEWAFSHCTGLTSITIPDSVASIGGAPFSDCPGLTSITVAEGNPVYDSRNNCNAIIETATNTLIAGCKNTVIPSGVTSINWSAFEGCTGLTSITIPSGVTSIGDNAFEDCTGLTEVHISDIAAWCGLSFGSYTTNPLYYAKKLYLNGTLITDLVIPSGVTSIGRGVFEGCTGLTSVTIGNGVTSIGKSAFKGCTGLTSITIPDSVTSIGEWAFNGCTGLTAISIPDSVTSIGYYAFKDCTGLTDIAILNPNCSIYNASATLAGKTKTIVYGYPGSTAQTYANKYGYTFKTLDEFPRELDYWANGSVYDAKTGRLTITVYKNRRAGNSDSVNYVLADIASVASNGTIYQLKNADTYETDAGGNLNKIASSGNGQISFPYTAGSVTVSANGYVSRTFTEKQLKNSTTVYLQKESDNYPVISGLWMDNTDIMNYDYAVNLTDSGTFTVTPEIKWDGSGTGTIRLLQGAHSLSVSASGTTVIWSDYFDVSEPIYIEAIGANGSITRKTLKLSAATAIPDGLDGLSLNWGDGISFTLPKSAGFLAGEEMSIGIFSPVKVDAVIDEGKVYVAIGYENGADWKKDGDKYKKEIKSWAEDVKNLKKNYSPSNFKNFAKKNYNKIAKTGGSFGFDADFSIVGFGEGYIDANGKFALVDAGLVVGCDGSVSYSYPFTIGIVPAFVEAKFKADLEAQLNLYINDSAKNFTPNGEIQFDISLSGGVGLGLNKVASVSGGLNGKLANTWDINFGETNYFRMVASLNFYAKATLAFLEYKHDFDPITQATWIEYPSPKKNITAAGATDFSAYYQIENYELQDLSYLYAGSSFLAASPKAKRDTAKSAAASETVFLQNSYESSKPQSVMFADGTMLAAWIGYDGSRTGYDSLCLYYSYYNGTEWSQPTVVEDDGSYDGDFALKQIGDTAYILWQNAEQPIGTEPEFEEVAGCLSMSAGRFDSENGIFQTEALSVQNGTLDMQPVLCGSGSTVYAVWLNNAENNVFGDNTENAILCSCFNGSEWGEVQPLYSGLASVESLAADYDGTNLQIAYCVDTDGDISTTEDLELWRSGVQITDNEICDSGVSFCSGTLYWYQNGSLISGSELSELTGLETDRYQIVKNDENKVLIYNLYHGLNSTLYARYYDSTSDTWGEPIALTDGTDSYNAFSASVDAAGKLTVLANRVAVIGEMTDSEPYGQADIVMLTVTPKTDLAVTDIFYDCSEYTENADMTFTVSVKNVGETAVHGMMAIITDENENELGHTAIPGTLLSGEETDIICGFSPDEIRLGQTVTVNVLPMNVEDEMPENNGIEAMLDFKDISLENTDWGFNAEGQAVIYADVVNRSYAAATNTITLSLREDSEDGTVVDTMVIDSMDALGVARVSFRTQPAEEKVLYITVETQNENENTANDTDFVVLTLPEDFPEEETEDLQIVSAALRLDEDIDILFTAQVPDGYSNPHLTVNGEDITEYTEQDGALLFVYTGIMPQCMGDNISATLYATCDDVEYSDTVAEYSVRTYCVNQLAKTDDATLKTLLSDILTYGAAAQIYMDYKTDTLVTDGLDLTPSTFEALSGKKVSFTGEANANIDWISATLVLSNDLATRFAFVADSIDGLTVDVTIGGRTRTFDAFEDAGDGKYYITFDGIMATEFDDTVTAAFYRNGEQISAAVNYSVNTYICGTQNCGNANLEALVKALYNYGASAKAYADTNK